jgi:hypothetical protein
VGAGAAAGMGGGDGGGDATGRRPTDGAVGTRGGHRRRLPVGCPHLRDHQTPYRQGQDLPIPSLRDCKPPAAAAKRFAVNRRRFSGLDLDSHNAVGAGVEQGGAAGGGDGEPSRVCRRVQAIGRDASSQGQPRRAAAREHLRLSPSPSPPLKSRGVFM